MVKLSERISPRLPNPIEELSFYNHYGCQIILEISILDGKYVGGFFVQQLNSGSGNGPDEYEPHFDTKDECLDYLAKKARLYLLKSSDPAKGDMLREFNREFQDFYQPSLF